MYICMYVCMYIKRREEGRAGMRMLKGWWWGNIYIYIYICIYIYILPWERRVGGW